MLPLIFDSVVSVIVKDDVYFDNYKLFNIGCFIIYFKHQYHTIKTP